MHSLAPRFHAGVALFNAGDYFACHEAWEDVWRELNGDQRLFVQGLIQIAVGLHHATRFNFSGAKSLLSRAVARLEAFSPSYAGINVAELLTAIAPWRAAVELREQLPSPPVLHCDHARMLESLFS